LSVEQRRKVAWKGDSAHDKQEASGETLRISVGVLPKGTCHQHGREVGKKIGLSVKVTFTLPLSEESGLMGDGKSRD